MENVYGNPLGGLFSSLLQERERVLLIAVALLLWEEKADFQLILAVLYVLF